MAPRERLSRQRERFPARVRTGDLPFSDSTSVLSSRFDTHLASHDLIIGLPPARSLGLNPESRHGQSKAYAIAATELGRLGALARIRKPVLDMLAATTGIALIRTGADRANVAAG